MAPPGKMGQIRNPGVNLATPKPITISLWTTIMHLTYINLYTSLYICLFFVSLVSVSLWFLSLCLCVSVSLCLCFSVSLCLCVSVVLCIYIILHSIYLSLSESIYLCTYISVSLFLCLPYITIWLSVPFWDTLTNGVFWQY